MKKNYITFRMMIVLSVLFLSIGMSAQTANQQRELSGAEAQKIVPQAETVLEGRMQMYPEYVKFSPDFQISPDNFKTWFKQEFETAKAVDFKLISTKEDKLGYTQSKYCQTFKGIPIDLSEYVVQSRDNKILSYMGQAYKVPDMSVQPKLSEKEALERALNYINADIYFWQSEEMEMKLKKEEDYEFASYYPQGKLLISNYATEDFRLVYSYDILALSPHSETRVIVDAQSGGILYILPLESNCSTPTSFTSIFNGSQTIRTDLYTATEYRLKNDCQTADWRVRDWNSTTDVHNAIEIENTTNTWTTQDERFGASVLWAIDESYDYFKNVHSRDSYDDANGDTEAYINAVFCTSRDPMNNCISYSTNNASMSFSGGRMKVGLSSAGTLANSYGTVDIIGHEYAHAVTGTSSGLVYQGESGALNESFSDIFGEMIENRTIGPNDWLLGDERTNGAIRSMSDPNAFNDPDTYMGTNWRNTCMGCSDAGGVHSNSGVQNFWFFLLSEGGSGTNDNGDFYSVSGIGRAKASAIAFRNQTIKLSSGSNYAAARTGAIAAAEDLYGVCSNEALQTALAWAAVGVGNRNAYDNTPPTIVCPVSIAGIQCYDNRPAPYQNMAEFLSAGGVVSDNCGVVVSVEYDGASIISGCPNSVIINRRYVATDESGNTSSCIQTILINDTQAPIASNLPSDMTLDCDDDAGIAAALAMEPTFSDNCTPPGDLQWFTISSIAGDPDCPEYSVTNRSWWVHDECGNSSVRVSQSITVSDFTAPVIAFQPPDVTLECDETYVPPYNDVSDLFTDNCDDDIFVIGDILVLSSFPCIYPQTFQYYFVATDNCGNSTPITWNVTYQDTKAPVADNLPVDVTLECDDAAGIAAAFAMEPTWTDNCTAPGDINIYPASSIQIDPDCPQYSLTTRTWYADDGCGNSSITVTQTILIQDTEAPIISCPNDITVKCTGEIPDVITDNAEWTSLGGTLFDNCGAMTISLINSEITQQTCEHRYLLTRTYRVTDECGNSSECDHKIRVDDDVIPMITCPVDITVQCASEVPDPDISTVIATDNCSGEVEIKHIRDRIIDKTCPNRFTLLREYRATDVCGNRNSCIQTITVYDDTAPVITWNNPLLQGVNNGQVIEIECMSQDPTWMPPTFDEGDATITDNCEYFDVDYTETFTEGNCAISYLRQTKYQWVATDLCGNQTTRYFYVRIIDRTDPTLKGIPEDITVACGTVVPVPEIAYCNEEAAEGMIKVYDQCECADVEYTETRINGSCPNSYVMVRKWRATDRCNNSVEDEQRITFMDTESPEIVITHEALAGTPNGGVYKYECNNFELPEWLDFVDKFSISTRDNCSSTSDITTTYKKEYIDYAENCTQLPYIERYKMTWYAEDECGNHHTYWIYVDLVDETAPIIYGVPEYVCDMDRDPWEGVSAEDACTFASLNMKETSSIDPCSGEPMKIRTYTATDVCGNSSTVVQKLYSTTGVNAPMHLVDGFPYEFGDTILFRCGRELPEWSAGDVELGSGICVENAKISYEVVETESEDCENTGIGRLINYQWTVTDRCGNDHMEQVTIAIMKLKNPKIKGLEETAQISCYDQWPQPVISGDECTNYNLDEVVDTLSANNSCDSYTEVRRTFTLSDNCGNEDSFVQLLTIGDFAGPKIYGLPENSCNDTSEVVAWAYDECTGDTVDVMYALSLGEPCEDGSIVVTRMWTAEDACGNMTSETRYSIVGAEGTSLQMETSHPILSRRGSGSTINVYCDENGEYPEFAAEDFYITGLCELALPITFKEQYISLGDCRVDRYREHKRFTWSAEDYCGRTAEYYIEVYFRDNTPPIIYNDPVDITVACGLDIPMPEIVALDNCGDIEESFNSFVSSQNEESYTIRRIWTIRDECGNRAIAQQYVTVLKESNFSCEIQTPVPAICNQNDYPVHVEMENGVFPYYYEWEVLEGICRIVEGQGTSDIKLALGYNDVVIGVWVTDHNGCLTYCEKRIECQMPEEAEPRNVVDSDIMIYPNPTSDQFYVSGIPEGLDQVSIRMIRMTGEVVYENVQVATQIDERGQVQVSTDNISSGAYLLIVESNGGIISRKVVQVFKK